MELYRIENKRVRYIDPQLSASHLLLHNLQLWVSSATRAEVAINWLLKEEDIIPIPGAKKKSQIESNIHATQWLILVRASLIT